MRHDTILPPDDDPLVEAEVEWTDEQPPPGLGCGALLVEGLASLTIALLLFALLVGVAVLLG